MYTTITESRIWSVVFNFAVFPFTALLSRVHCKYVVVVFGSVLFPITKELLVQMMVHRLLSLRFPMQGNELAKS